MRGCELTNGVRVDPGASWYWGELTRKRGTLSSLLILSRILFSFSFWLLLFSQVSHPLVIIGIMQVSRIVHIVSICIALKFSSPAIKNVDCRAASVSFSISSMCLLILFLLLMISPRYLYWSVGLIIMLSVLSSIGSCFVPIVSVLDFSCPNCILYLLAVSSVIFSSIFWSSMLLVISATSSTQRRHVESSSILLSGLCFAIMISLFISSISVAYCVTANTPPWRMLFLIVDSHAMQCESM